MKTAVAFAMALMLGFSSVSYVGVPNMTAYAFTTTKGLVVNGPARVRRAPVDGEHFATFVNGTVITVVDETMGSDGYNWYKVSFSYNNVPFEGYCRADLIELLQEDEVLPNSASTVIELSDAAVAEATGAADATSTETSNAVEGATTDTGATSGETVDTAVDTTTDTTAAVDNSAVALTTETATTQRVGTCTGDNVNVRAGAGTSFSSLAKVNKGHTMTVIGETTSNGALWYNVSLVVSGVAYSGWIHGNYVTVTTITTGVTSEDEAYVAALQAAGFPESYCNSLLQLHKKYPAWQPFEPANPFAMFSRMAQRAPGQDPPSTEQLIAAGWGYAMIDPSSIQADNGAGLTRGIIGLVNKGQPRKPDDWGSLRAWAWGAARGLDYLETDPDVDAKHVGIEGVSRYGKAALVTLAFEERFAMGLIGSSGKGGAALHRRIFGEGLENLTGSGEYHWMAGNYIKYASVESKTGAWTADMLPVDSHQLIALCAPRLVFISYGIPEQGDALWLDQYGSWQATIAAGEALKLLGATDLGL